MSQKCFMVSARELASFVGKFISASAVLGNISRIITRYYIAGLGFEVFFGSVMRNCVLGNQFTQSEFEKY